MATAYLVFKVVFDANWNSIEETILVGANSVQLVKTLQQNTCAAVQLLVDPENLWKRRKASESLEKSRTKHL